MRRLLTALVAITLGITIALAAATPAQAFGSETLGCRIAPGTQFNWYPACNNDTGFAYTYNVGFLVQNTSGSGYSYTWSITGQHGAVITGCTSTSNVCAVYATRRAGSYDITATVTVTQGGQSGTLYSIATIDPWCYDQEIGYYLC